MCGLTGFWSADPTDDAPGILRRMAGAIRHRGPDDEGYWWDAECGLGLAFRRLSILDLSPKGHQPMVSASGRYVVVFNGEIYNFKDLRRTEEAHGACFEGHSDTEVMLAAIERRGLNSALGSFHGMFALALWDRATRTLHLVRDRLGEKPLYYGWMGRTLLFGSELKALRAHPAWRGDIDRDALGLMLRYSYVPGPYSIYRGVRKVAPATIESFHAGEPGLAPEVTRYWTVRADAESAIPTYDADSEEALIDEFDELLRRTVRDEMVADVPLGAFLSGGIDSSLIVGAMQAESSRPVQTFTIGFREARYDESRHARAIAHHLGTSHTELCVTPAESMAVIPRLPTLYDEPFADPSQIPTFLVSQLARSQVSVSLSGDGGDELFGGYDRYLLSEGLRSRVGRLPGVLRTPLATALKAVSPHVWDRGFRMVGGGRMGDALTGERVHKFAALLELEGPQAFYRQMLSHWPDPTAIVPGATEPATLLADAANWPPSGDFVSQMMYLDLLTYLPDDILVKVDRASMGVSLESRAPLLDHRIVEFAWRLPRQAKIRGGRGKWLLRRTLDRYVPRALVERPKMGFGVPIDEWLRGELKEWAGDLLAPALLKRQGYLNAGLVEQKWKEHTSGQRNWQFPLWDVLMFQAWLAAQPG
jgi:asparagine synthase (glutamine-hydrolysing)